MPASVGRNDPCPCGSGKKHKACCLGKPPPQVRRKFMVLPMLLGTLSVAAGVYAGITAGLGAGLATAAAGLIVATVIQLFRDPPPPAGKSKDAGAINFGGRR